jgi:hypothetical protein
MPHQTDSSDPQTEYRDVVQERVMLNKEEGVARAAVQKRNEFKVFDQRTDLVRENQREPDRNQCCL